MQKVRWRDRFSSIKNDHIQANCRKVVVLYLPDVPQAAPATHLGPLLHHTSADLRCRSPDSFVSSVDAGVGAGEHVHADDYAYGHGCVNGSQHSQTESQSSYSATSLSASASVSVDAHVCVHVHAHAGVNEDASVRVQLGIHRSEAIASFVIIMQVVLLVRWLLAVDHGIRRRASYCCLLVVRRAQSAVGSLVKLRCLDRRSAQASIATVVATKRGASCWPV